MFKKLALSLLCLLMLPTNAFAQDDFVPTPDQLDWCENQRISEDALELTDAQLAAFFPGATVELYVDAANGETQGCVFIVADNENFGYFPYTQTDGPIHVEPGAISSAVTRWTELRLGVLGSGEITNGPDCLPEWGTLCFNGRNGMGLFGEVSPAEAYEYQLEMLGYALEANPDGLPSIVEHAIMSEQMQAPIVYALGIGLLFRGAQDDNFYKVPFDYFIIAAERVSDLPLSDSYVFQTMTRNNATTQVAVFTEGENAVIMSAGGWGMVELVLQEADIEYTFVHGALDTDGDTIVDVRDECPEVPGVFNSDNQGCP